MMTLATISLQVGDDANLIYDLKVLARLFDIGEAINANTSHRALDAVRNLINQAFLAGMDEQMNRILSNGYLELLHRVVVKCVKLLQLAETSQ